ncbi:hypothetical protein BWZ22_13115 [Seonamhaeicola sp. S2-3]|uniref:hypothetical protein n=1 Tax=Seonamhaeicola sp. S2-3 TaxID=1936081 RepID=UPI000972A96C|nr:hypothetical protein [Seonamhaeicola sp. S2-3]APY12111.1 hypothetical protein BWZ22_13115 [Seonamhaeicola sp. S2-3]
MARQKGLFKIRGTLGEVNYYVINGVGYARKAGGGFNSKAIRSQPNMQRVRENASEFGHCSRVKKALRLAFVPFLQGYKDTSLHGRMMTLLTSIKALDKVSERGQRCVGEGLKTAKGRHLLTHFAFTPQHKSLEALVAHTLYDWHTQLLTVTSFSPKTYKAPKEATHIGISLGVLDFDFDSLNYNLVVSPTHFMEVEASAASFTLTPDTVVTPKHTGIAVLGLRYYEVIEQEVYRLDQNTGFRIISIYI